MEITFNKYNSKNKPKKRYSFETLSSEIIVENLKSGKLSKDAGEVAFYLLKYERNLKENILNEIKTELKKISENSVFEKYKLIINERDDSFKMEFKKSNRLISFLLILLLVGIYILILPFSIKKLQEDEYIYVFGALIVLFPFFIFKASQFLKNEKKFQLVIDTQFFTIKSVTTNYKKYAINKSDVLELKIIEKENFELKLIAIIKNQEQIEILTEMYSNFDKGNVREYLNTVKNKIQAKLIE